MEITKDKQNYIILGVDKANGKDYSVKSYVYMCEGKIMRIKTEIIKNK